MTCNNFYIFCDSNLYFYGFLLSFLIIVISKYWRNFFNKISIFNTYNTLQKTHESETSRLGGLIFWLVLSLYLFFGNLNENIEYFLGMIFLSSIPFLKTLHDKIGFSDHSDNLLNSKQAIFQGIDMLERHFTILDKDQTRDGKVSVTPNELKELKDFSGFSKEKQYNILNKFDDKQNFNHTYYKGRFK